MGNNQFTIAYNRAVTMANQIDKLPPNFGPILDFVSQVSLDKQYSWWDWRRFTWYGVTKILRNDTEFEQEIKVSTKMGEIDTFTTTSTLSFGFGLTQYAKIDMAYSKTKQQSIAASGEKTTEIVIKVKANSKVLLKQKINCWVVCLGSQYVNVKAAWDSVQSVEPPQIETTSYQDEVKTGGATEEMDHFYDMGVFLKAVLSLKLHPSMRQHFVYEIFETTDSYEVQALALDHPKEKINTVIPLPALKETEKTENTDINHSKERHTGQEVSCSK
jgi:hypothetical protein